MAQTDTPVKLNLELNDSRQLSLAPHNDAFPCDTIARCGLVK